MSNLKTKITWNIHDFCRSECSYCPIHLRGASEIPETKEYLRVARLIIDAYAAMGRTIDWTINGGEPLDMNDIVTLLKLCKSESNSIDLTTNGGKLWMDWWAIEPYVDNLNLSYHYWQNPALIKFIVDTFKTKGKRFTVSSPIRPDFFEEDMTRVLEAEQQCGITIGKTLLYNNADKAGGMFKYSNEQLMIMSGVRPRPPSPRPPEFTPPIPLPPLVQEKKYFETTSWDQRYKQAIISNPSYTGQKCNVGIERLVISHSGWVSGSDCNNQPLGNIWHSGWTPPSGAQVCTMQACISSSDQKITKFPI